MQSTLKTRLCKSLGNPEGEVLSIVVDEDSFKSVQLKTSRIRVALRFSYSLLATHEAR